MNTKPAVIVVRDPDSGNRFVTFGDVDVFDVDLGHGDLTDADEASEWLASHSETITTLRRAGATQVARLYKQQVLLALDGFGWVGSPDSGVCLRCGHRPRREDTVCHSCHRLDPDFAERCENLYACPGCPCCDDGFRAAALDFEGLRRAIAAAAEIDQRKLLKWLNRNLNGGT